MSADNWGICPKCRLEEKKRIDDLKLKAGEAYGKVSQEEYLAMLDEIDIGEKHEHSLREDYHLGTDEYGEFCINYYCYCDCGFKFKYELQKNLLEETA